MVAYLKAENYQCDVATRFSEAMEKRNPTITIVFYWTLPFPTGMGYGVKRIQGKS